MRLPQPVRMAEDSAGPVWARARRSRGNPVLRIAGTVLALVGLLILVLAGIDRSFAKSGARIDAWIGSAVHMQAPEGKLGAAVRPVGMAGRS